MKIPTLAWLLRWRYEVWSPRVLRRPSLLLSCGVLGTVISNRATKTALLVVSGGLAFYGLVRLL